MTRRDSGDDTMNTVRGRYQDWNEANPRPRGRSALRMPVMNEGIEKMVGVALGVGAGVVLLALCAVAVAAAASWAEVGRDGAVVAYAITALFLGMAGAGALVGTWNHLFRVIPGQAAHH